MRFTESELTVASKIGRKMATKWSAVESDDLVSHLTLWLCENYATVERYRTEEGGDAKLFVSLRREAGRFCAKEQAQRTGAPLDHDAQYSVDQIERILPFVFEDLPSQSVSENPHSGAPLSKPDHEQFETAIAMALDVRSAYHDLPAEIRSVLVMRYRDGMSYEEIGSLTGMTDRGAQKRVLRAVTRLRDSLSAF